MIRLTETETEFAVWVNFKLRTILDRDSIDVFRRFPTGRSSTEAQRLCVDVAECLSNTTGFRSRRRAFYALCIKGIPGCDNWLEILDSGNVTPTFLNPIRREVCPVRPTRKAIYDEPLGAS